MFSIIDLIIAAGGIYVIYLYVDMKKTGTIRENMLLPKGLNVKRCKDPAGYIRTAAPKQLILGIIVLACGIAGLLQDFAHVIDSTVYFLLLLVLFVYIIWYTAFMKKVVKKFW